MTIRKYEVCRAREPDLGVQCEVTGPHDQHVITGVRNAGSKEVRRWYTCNAVKPFTFGRPCLFVLGHDGEHDW